MAQVMDRKEAIAEQLLRPKEVCQVGTAEPPAGGTVAACVKGLILVQVPRVPEVHASPCHPRLAVARYPRWENGIKEVNSAQYRFQQINWGSEPHQIAHAMIAI